MKPHKVVGMAAGVIVSSIGGPIVSGILGGIIGEAIKEILENLSEETINNFIERLVSRQDFEELIVKVFRRAIHDLENERLKQMNLLPPEEKNWFNCAFSLEEIAIKRIIKRLALNQNAFEELFSLCLPK